MFAALYGTVALLPDDLRATVRGFVVNRLRGDPALLGDACAELERRCGVPTLGVLPHLGVVDIDNEDSPGPRSPARTHPAAKGDTVDVAAVRWPRVANAGDLDPLRLEPGVQVRWVRSAAELGRPDLVVLPGSKNTRGDLAWFRGTGLAAAVERSDAAVVAVCAGLQMAGGTIEDPDGVEGPAGSERLGWLPVVTSFRGDKVLDRPAGRHRGPGPGAGCGRLPHPPRAGPAGRAGRRGWWLRTARSSAGTTAGGRGRRCTGCSSRRVPRRDGGVGGGTIRQAVVAGRELRCRPGWTGSTASPMPWRPTSTSTGSWPSSERAPRDRRGRPRG